MWKSDVRLQTEGRGRQVEAFKKGFQEGHFSSLNWIEASLSLRSLPAQIPAGHFLHTLHPGGNRSVKNLGQRWRSSAVIMKHNLQKYKIFMFNFFK